ncbi:MAG: hypothetical protein M3P93_15130 [Actinomycetota bacterium]|nr:hypothetical protein [Actinomycetota bacterium]
MHPRLRRVLLAATALAVALPGTALAHDEDHPGRYIPSPESASHNLKLLASSDKTAVAPTYRNSDLAFKGDLVFAGNYEGFRVLDVSEPESPRVLADVPCAGAQHDVSVHGDLLFLSVDAPRTAPGCDSAPVATGAPGWEGIRIFDVSDPRSPVYRGAVATDCGSHTHTLVPQTDRALLYVSSYPAGNLGTSPYGNSCARTTADGGQGHSKMSIVSVPLAAPERAEVVAQPQFELKDFNRLAGFRGCHDVTVFTGLQRAAAACLSEAQIWDISDPLKPTTLARVHNPHVQIWHSAAFTWDGKVVALGDEAGGGGAPFCRARDASTVGAMWFYDLASLRTTDATTQATPLGHWKTPRVQGDAANCTTHNFNILPVAGRYVAVASSYSAGTSVVDFTDPARAVEVAHNDPHGANTWSSYWHDGFVYTNDSGRGVGVMLFSDRLRAGVRKLGVQNPQTQQELVLPSARG